ncbi:MAG: hypothetical protein QF659_02730 [Dehalococcoidia bacterium]|jgi:hypothetical protein|nr:hypothetical protein [Dehalococcoidia bacterium]
MDELFSTHLPDGERPDLQFCIFPHLREFLVIDQREYPPRVVLLNAADVFVEEFFRAVEAQFSESVREETDFPFAHLINLPLRVETAIRETAMSFILDRLGIGPEAEEDIPTVVVFIVSGGALEAHSERVLDGLRTLVRSHCGETAVTQWEKVLSRLVTEEASILQKQHLTQLTEALRGDSPDYFTLWEHRN